MTAELVAAQHFRLAVLVAVSVALTVSACQQGIPLGSPTPTPGTPTPPLGSPTPPPGIPTSSPVVTDEVTDLRLWTAYDSDAAHPWNRLHRALFRRVDQTGREFGRQALDPYIWSVSLHLRRGAAHTEALTALDALLLSPRDGPWLDPVRRAMLQRDLWAVFDQVTAGGEGSRVPQLEVRLARAIRALALPREEILALPDVLELAVASQSFPVAYDGNINNTYLPPGLRVASGEWICLGREDGLAAITHVESFPFYGRSLFLPCLRAPGGQGATTDFLRALQARPRGAAVPEGAEVALIRQALLIDDEGEVVLSPLVESIQLRYLHAAGGMRSFDLSLDRDLLSSSAPNMLRATSRVAEEPMLFRSHMNDPFGNTEGVHGVARMTTCQSCHVDRFQGISGAASILTVSRARFDLPDGMSGAVEPVEMATEALRTIAWKLAHPSWERLRSAGDSDSE
jgi:hypothetical protein